MTWCATIRRRRPPTRAEAIAQVGPLFWPFLVYADLVVWGCTALFVWTLLRLSRLYWRQSLLLIVTLLLPILANLLHNLNVGPFGRVELTPFLLVLTGAVLVWGVFRFRLLDLAPIARSQIFQLMQDAVVVLDPYGRVVDANLAAERLLGQPVGQVVGQPLAQLVPGWTTALSHGHGASTSSDTSREEAIIAGRAYELTVSALPDRQGQPTGELLIARDVSERRQAERDLRDSLVREQAATERLSAALQREQTAAEQPGGRPAAGADRQPAPPRAGPDEGRVPAGRLPRPAHPAHLGAGDRRDPGPRPPAVGGQRGP